MKQHKASNPNRIVRNTTKPRMTKEAYNLDQRVQQLWRHTTVMEKRMTELRELIDEVARIDVPDLSDRVDRLALRVEGLESVILQPSFFGRLRWLAGVWSTIPRSLFVCGKV